MKIALVGAYPLLDPVRIDGGVEAATFYLAQGLAASGGDEVHAVSVTKRVQAECQACDGDIAVHYLPEPRTRIVPNAIRNIPRLRRLIEGIRPDIVNGGSPSATLAGLKAGYPSVHTIHGVMHNEGCYFGNSFADRLNARMCTCLANRAISGASHCIAVSSYVLNEYRDIARSGITVIPNAVDDRFFQVRGDEVPDRMLYVGFVGWRKNILGLVRAFATIKRARPLAELIIAGRGHGQDYSSQVTQCVDEHGLADSVHFLDLVDQDRLLMEHARASVVCIFSWHETFSLTVAQGMAAGKPVVSSDSGGPSDLIVDGETGFLVAPGDEEAFAEKSILLLEDAGLRSRMGAAGREVAQQRFSKEVVAARTAEVYKRALGEHPAAGRNR